MEEEVLNGIAGLLGISLALFFSWRGAVRCDFDISGSYIFGVLLFQRTCCTGQAMNDI